MPVASWRKQYRAAAVPGRPFFIVRYRTENLRPVVDDRGLRAFEFDAKGARDAMTVSDLIAKLSRYPSDTRVTLLDPDEGWLLPIEIARLPADGCNREVDFIAITADATSDEIEGLAGGSQRRSIGRHAGSGHHQQDDLGG